MKKGFDVPLYTAYYRKSEKTYVIGKSVMLSELFKDGKTRAEVAKLLCDRCTELGKMDLSGVETGSTSGKTDEKTEDVA